MISVSKRPQERTNLDRAKSIGESTSRGDSKAKNYAIIGRIGALLELARLSKQVRLMTACPPGGRKCRQILRQRPLGNADFVIIRTGSHSLSAANLRQRGWHISVSTESSPSDNRDRFPQAAFPILIRPTSPKSVSVLRTTRPVNECYVDANVSYPFEPLSTPARWLTSPFGSRRILLK